MARCEFIPGLGLVSGTLRKSTYRDKNGVHTTRLFAQVRNGKQRIYMRQETPRSTPPSEKELAARKLFEKRSALVWQLMEEQHISRSEAWKIAKEQISSN